MNEDRVPVRPQLRLRRFPVETMPDNSMCVIVAQSEGGKTTLGIDLMYHKRHLPAWYLFSTSEGCSQRLSQIIPKIYTKTKFDLDKLKKIYNHQERKMRRYTRERSEAERRAVPDDELPIEERFKKNPCVGGYFEDCFSDTKLFGKPIVKDLFKNGRHRMMFSIVPCQYVMDLKPELRNQVKYWFILREDNPETRKKLFTHVGGACKTFEIFNEIMDQCTHDYRCVVIDNISKSRNIEDRVFWYKADLHPAFRVGCTRYWKFHKRNFTESKCVDEDEAMARAKLRSARQRMRRGAHRLVPPGALRGANGATHRFGGAVEMRGADNYLLDTTSMAAAFQQGNNTLETMLFGKQRERQFDVAMLPTPDNSVAAGAVLPYPVNGT